MLSKSNMLMIRGCNSFRNGFFGFFDLVNKQHADDTRLQQYLFTCYIQYHNVNEQHADDTRLQRRNDPLLRYRPVRFFHMILTFSRNATIACLFLFALPGMALRAFR
jgi:hypothetical protein